MDKNHDNKYYIHDNYNQGLFNNRALILHRLTLEEFREGSKADPRIVQVNMFILRTLYIILTNFFFIL